MAQTAAATCPYLGNAAEIFEQFDRANLPKPIWEPVRGALTVLLDDDEDDEPVRPDMASFHGFLTFLITHADVQAPSIGINRQGLFVAVWQDPTFRLSFEFQPGGDVAWASTEKHGIRPSVRNGSATMDRAPLPPRRREPTYA